MLGFKFAEACFKLGDLGLEELSSTRPFLFVVLAFGPPVGLRALHTHWAGAVTFLARRTGVKLDGQYGDVEER